MRGGSRGGWDGTMGQIDRQLVTACQAGCGYDRRLIPSINCDGVSGPGGISLSNRETVDRPGNG